MQTALESTAENRWLQKLIGRCKEIQTDNYVCSLLEWYALSVCAKWVWCLWSQWTTWRRPVLV